MVNEGALNLLRGFSSELFTVLLETTHALDRVNMLIAFACWHCEDTSFHVSRLAYSGKHCTLMYRQVACALLKSVDSKSWQRTYAIQSLFETFVMLDDPLRTRRLELFHKVRFS